MTFLRVITMSAEAIPPMAKRKKKTYIRIVPQLVRQKSSNHSTAGTRLQLFSQESQPLEQVLH